MMDLNKILQDMVSGDSLKPPVIITDRYVDEHYQPDQVLDASVLGNVTEPPNISDTKIKVVKLQECNLQNIPSWIFNISEIEGLLVDRNPELEIIPDDIRNLKNLKVLGLMRTNTKTYGFLKGLSELEVLDISANDLDTFPKEVCKLERLNALDISSYNSFTSIPDCLCSIKSLRELRAHFNAIEVLPDRLGELKNLEKLILGKNKIKELPQSIYTLDKLQELDLFGNRIQEVDLKLLSQIKGLNTIFLSQNPIKDFPSELLDHKTGALSASSLHDYYSTGRYSKLPDEENISNQIRRLVRSSRALIVRAIYYFLNDDYKSSYNFLVYAYEISKRYKNDQFLVLSGVLIGYIYAFAFKDSDAPYKVFMEASSWAKKINSDIHNHTPNLTRYRQVCNQFVLHISGFYGQNALVDIAQYNDFIPVLDTVFVGPFAHLIHLDSPDALMIEYYKNVEYYLDGLNHRDLIRGLAEQNDWLSIENELFIQQSKGRDNVVNHVSLYTPLADNEVSMLVLQISNDDKLRVRIKYKNSHYQILVLESSSIELNTISEKLFANNAGIPQRLSHAYAQQVVAWGEEKARITFKIQHKFGLYDDILKDDDSIINLDNENDYIFQPLWSTIFGSRIIDAYNYNAESGKVTKANIEQNTLHGYLQKSEINQISFFPVGSLSSIPLGSAFSKSGNHYAIECYQIVYLPVAVKQKDNSFSYNKATLKHEFTNRTPCSFFNDELPFAKAECNLIADIYDNSVSKNLDCIGDELDMSLNKASLIHIASHARDNKIHLSLSGAESYISSDDVLNLKLTANLVFLNACRTSVASHIGLDNSHLFSLCFMLAGAKNVITTNSSIPDTDSFRIAIRFYELLSAHSSGDIVEVFHNLIRECIKNDVPYYSERLLGSVDEEAFSRLMYKEKYDRDNFSAWKYYTIWKS